MPPNKETVLSGDFTSTLTIMQEYFPQASHLLSLVATFLTLTIESGILPQLVGYIASDDLDAMATAVEMLPRFTSKIEYLYQMISADILTHLHRIPQVRALQ